MLAWTVGGVDDNTFIYVNDVQYVKAYAFINETLLGIIIYVIDLQFIKDLRPIDVMVLGNCIWFILVHSPKARVPIVLTPSGIFNDVRLLQL